MTDLFISYARVDRGRIEILAALLEEAGYSVWWDRQIVAGTAFDKEIERALQDARCVIVAWSEHSVGSDWVRAEAAFALETNKLVPIALDRSHPPIRFIHTHTLDLTDWNGAGDHPSCARLISDLRALIGPPGEPVERPATPRPRPEARNADFARTAAAWGVGSGGSGGAMAVAMAVPGGGSVSAPLRPAMGSKGVRIALGVVVALALLIGAHIAYPAPLIALLGGSTAGVKSDVARRLDGLRCSTIAVDVSKDFLFRTNVRLSGVVSTDDDVASAADLAHLRDVSKVSSSLQVVPWPFCEVINAVQTTIGPAPAQGAPAIDGDHPDMVWKDGDRLVLDVAMTSLFDGYLYVDFIDDDGTVAHMLPNPRHADNKLKAGQSVKLGAAAGDKNSKEQAYEISAPFGKRMIIASASRKPLFNQARDQVETAATYFAALRAAFDRARSGDKSELAAVSVYRFITTQEK
jgi:hypothetical protein